MKNPKFRAKTIGNAEAERAFGFSHCPCPCQVAFGRRGRGIPMGIAFIKAPAIFQPHSRCRGAAGLELSAPPGAAAPSRWRIPDGFRLRAQPEEPRQVFQAGRTSGKVKTSPEPGGNPSIPSGSIFFPPHLSFSQKLKFSLEKRKKGDFAMNFPGGFGRIPSFLRKTGAVFNREKIPVGNNSVGAVRVRWERD